MAHSSELPVLTFLLELAHKEADLSRRELLVVKESLADFVRSC